jgi:hypothetical protein
VIGVAASWKPNCHGCGWSASAALLYANASAAHNPVANLRIAVVVNRIMP